MWTIEDMPDQTGKRAIVTGANSGLGLESARALAGRGASVIMACRDTARGEEAKQEILALNPKADLAVWELDLASLDSVTQFARRYTAEYPMLDILVNNAGVMMPPQRGETTDGSELQFGTNHLGHFALTGLLLGSLKSAGNARVVTVSSMAHRRGEIDFDDLQGETGSYDKTKTYGTSKLANLLFTYELQRRLDEQGEQIIAVAAHPGWSGTNLQRHTPLFDFMNQFFAQDAAMGALPTLVGATSTGVSGGDYFGPGGFMEMRGHPKKVESSQAAKDEEVADRLWEVSEQLTGVTYDF